jgi:hypothetical protein
MYREIALPARMASLFPTYKIGVVCQEGRIGALLALGDGEKINFKPVKQTRGQDSHENMGHCRRRADRSVLSQLYGAASRYG